MTLQYPDNLVAFEKREAEEEIRHAKIGVMYGSAVYTGFAMCCEGLLEEFEKGSTVEEALHNCACEGYEVDWFDYEPSYQEKYTAFVKHGQSYRDEVAPQFFDQTKKLWDGGNIKQIHDRKWITDLLNIRFDDLTEEQKGSVVEYFIFVTKEIKID